MSEQYTADPVFDGMKKLAIPLSQRNGFFTRGGGA
jgi:hypothetical protein